MKRIALAVVLLISIQLVAQSEPTSAATKPKVRAITRFVRLDQRTYEKQIAAALEQRILYPRGAKSEVTVTFHSGKQMNGTLAYLYECVVGMRDGNCTYRSWQIDKVKYSVKSPVEAHVDQSSKYTDADIHNLIAYLQTLR